MVRAMLHNQSHVNVSRLLLTSGESPYRQRIFEGPTKRQRSALSAAQRSHFDPSMFEIDEFGQAESSCSMSPDVD